MGNRMSLIKKYVAYPLIKEDLIFPILMLSLGPVHTSHNRRI